MPSLMASRGTSNEGVRAGRDDRPRVRANRVRHPSANWDCVRHAAQTFGSLSDVLSRYVEAGAEKYWERVTR